MRPRLLALCCLAFPLCASAQDSATPTLHSGTQIVVVDVTVADSHGQAITHLKPSDFVVLEDAAPQVVSHFEEHTAADQTKTPMMPPLGQNVYTNFTPVSENVSTNILLIDSLNTPVSSQSSNRQKLISFIKTMKPGTRLAVFDLSTRLMLLQGFTSDPELLLAAVHSDSAIQSSAGLPDSLGSAESLSDTVRIPSPQILGAMRQTEAVQSTEQDRLRVLTTLGAMNQLARYLSGVPGRKNLLWVSGSFPLNFLPHAGIRNSFATTESFQTEVRETMNLLSRSQVAIYPIDAGGVQNSPLADASAGRYALGSNRVAGDVDTFSSQSMDTQGTMQRLAESTGGNAALETNDLQGALTKAIEAGSNYYSLVYSPTNKKNDGKYRKINVRLVSGSYKLGYRDGYYAADADAKSATPHSAEKHDTVTPPDSMQLAMQRGAPTPTEIIFKALFAASSVTSRQPAEGNVAAKSKPPYRLITVAYAANPGDITMPSAPDGLRHVDLDFVALVYDRDGQLFTQQINRVDVFAKPQAVQDFLREGVRYQQQIAVPVKGEYYLRTGIHDLLGNKIGVIEVPVANIAITPQGQSAVQSPR
ncbi:MAG TPA: VWA domain-containing protein [Edaphobacter sp.]|jgi:VWFA-related protein|nr:VWA domain-containing protein [Edaphobacter sp.]